MWIENTCWQRRYSKTGENVFKRTRNQSQASGNKRYKRNEEDNTDKRITAVKRYFQMILTLALNGKHFNSPVTHRHVKIKYKQNRV